MLLIGGAILVAVILIALLVTIFKEIPSEKLALTNTLGYPPKGYEDRFICVEEKTFFTLGEVTCYANEDCEAELIEKIKCVKLVSHRILLDQNGGF